MEDDDEWKREVDRIVIPAISCLITGIIVGLAIPVIFNLGCLISVKYLLICTILFDILYFLLSIKEIN